MAVKHADFINGFLLIILILIVFYLSFFYAPKRVSEPQQDCLKISLDSAYTFDSCYDAVSKNIFLKMKRGYDSNKILSIGVSFFDFSNKNFEIYDGIPKNGEDKVFKISAAKNPESLDVVVNPVENSGQCNAPKKVFVSYCAYSDNVSLTLSSLDSSVRDIVNVASSSVASSDSFSLNLVDREKIWETKCSSNWQCTSWESCANGVQKRTCKDLNGCFISTSSPQTEKFCNNSCVENWQCTWEKCSGGYSIPDCKDLNSCGTNFDLPSKVQCGSSCIPDVSCGEWSLCKADYTFIDLINFEVGSLKGIKTRNCVDKNSCTKNFDQSEECSLSINIYTKKVDVCGKEYLGIYNKLTNQLIAKIEKGTSDSPFLNIAIDGGEYCDYCYDGIKDGDEKGIDCGGGCKPC